MAFSIVCVLKFLLAVKSFEILKKKIKSKENQVISYFKEQTQLCVQK